MGATLIITAALMGILFTIVLIQWRDRRRQDIDLAAAKHAVENAEAAPAPLTVMDIETIRDLHRKAARTRRRGEVHQRWLQEELDRLAGGQ